MYVRLSSARPDLAQAARTELARRGYQFEKALDFVKSEKWTFSKELRVADVMRNIKSIPGIVSVQPDIRLYFLGGSNDPNDDLFDQQYALENMEVVESWPLVEGRESVRESNFFSVN